ncbi:hypothetical protein ACFQDN_05900 [Pseudomonas asuensis]|uniref:Uncharacterized protein n=1 Tax=Pseudomonas asuensis TaxID=1825787 RepID=A0ABQ2GSP1_9PSED|nr:hypothetical protein [Pseudomonas asuensis]GGM10006.1 hypothetical protein GCM10009425_21420 [Pseudomonas asuensis]
MRHVYALTSLEVSFNGLPCQEAGSIRCDDAHRVDRSEPGALAVSLTLRRIALQEA